MKKEKYNPHQYNTNGSSKQSGNGSATLVFGCAKLSTSVIIALPFRQPFTEPDMDS